MDVTDDAAVEQLSKEFSQNSSVWTWSLIPWAADVGGVKSWKPRALKSLEFIINYCI